jgi:DNA polymerase III delta subunit
VSDTDSSNVFLISGDDEAMIEAEAAKIVRRVAGDNPDPFALDVIREHDGASTADVINQVVRSILSPSFLGGRKTVWLQNFSSFGSEGTASSKGAEAAAFRALAEHIKQGVPEDIVLIMSGPGIDGKKALARACGKHGVLTRFQKPDVTDRKWTDAMRTAIQTRAADKGISLPPEVCEFLVGALGTDTGRIEGELEKLICYCGGPEAPITLADAEALVSSQGEEASWALSNAVGDRNIGDALRVVDVLMRQSKDTDRTGRSLIGQTARFFRELLQVKIFMAMRRMRSARAMRSVLEGLSPEEKQACREQGMGFVDSHWYRGTMLAEQSRRYEGHELIEALRACRDAYWKAISSAMSSRITLEEMLVRIVGVNRH